MDLSTLLCPGGPHVLALLSADLAAPGSTVGSGGWAPAGLQLQLRRLMFQVLITVSGEKKDEQNAK